MQEQAAVSWHFKVLQRNSRFLCPHSPFTDRVHVHTHRGNLAAAVLVKFVATGLTPEAVKEKLVAEITVSQLEECFPYLHNQRGNDKNTSTSKINPPHTKINNNNNNRCDGTYKVVHSERDIIQDFNQQLLSLQRSDIRVPVRQSFPAAKRAERWECVS